MISYLEGVIIYKTPGLVVLKTGGVGYQIFVPPSHHQTLPAISENASLFTSLVIREETLELYGFLTPGERDLFLLLQHTSGIGPRTALNIVSALSPDDLARAIQERDISRLSSIPGVGRKTAERLCVELKDRFKTMVSPEKDPDLFADAVSALLNLGFKRRQAEDVVSDLISQGKRDLEALIKDALRLLSHE
ncbi:Holliday junction branch migration protein RuvA [Thermosulfuriphilus ammonigenes]|uniref:Holliday junction branch migration complex subunit RuvA n=1 Tax=Thermosulfuriphilus ammonigenes TaxID=1936021 RepID=A0A6G7PTC9_9BACT|nr:Holliday junction branch migration protein RuvA [Thermosulfuriphilus ammonigenes]MBA2849201.1 Holliday junction DNA helicase RuvA [Thermosulfuriphilus ammonigenes]QIJ70816.1 Holliday junction branch migration protein RuvA [Thermosulfuriphilus ammonigenes]